VWKWWHQGRRNVGRAGGAVQKLRAMETYEKQKNRYQLCLLLLNNSADLKYNKRDYRKFVSIRSWQIKKLAVMLLWNRFLWPRWPSYERSGGNATPIRCPCIPLSAVICSLHYLPRCLPSTVTCGKTLKITAGLKPMQPMQSHWTPRHGV